MKNEEVRSDRFRDFESDMLPEEEAAPRQERARRRREAEKRVYTIAGVFLGLILVIASATMLFIRGKNDASAGEAVVSHEDTLTEVVDAPMVTMGMEQKIQMPLRMHAYASLNTIWLNLLSYEKMLMSPPRCARRVL